jgi:EAL domain-containing protein (putative c-di-GMP-specific phosphodiesterase class I)
VRWNHPRHGVLSPGVFLPIAEETGLIVPLGRFVLRTACKMLRRWQQAGLASPDLSVSVNLGRQQLTASDLVHDVRAALADSGLDPKCLILEITEDVLLTRDGMVERLTELKRLGLRLAVDDFGTGYSALSHLQRYPIDIIKIDKAFVDGLGESEDHARLIRGIIELTHSLGLKTVAEGIETRRQAELLGTMGSELGQGFHFARPLPSGDLEALLAPPAGDLGDLELAV